VNVNLEDKYGNTALHKSIFDNHCECALFLLGKGASILSVNHDGATPLHKGKKCFIGKTYVKAAESGHLEMIRLLVKESKQILIVNSVDNNLNTSLHLAAKRGFAVCCEELLKFGAELNAKNKEGWTGKRNVHFTKSTKLYILQQRREMQISF
jgi:ankyrin repeat protein